MEALSAILCRSGVGVSHSVSSGLGEVRSGSAMYGMVLVRYSSTTNSCGPVT